MAALDYLSRAGLTVEVVADKLRASPVGRITPELRQYLRDHKTEILVELAAANDPQQPRTWLHLLVLANGRVIQRAGDQNTASVEQDARLQYADNLLAVVAVNGFERPLTEVEIVKALAGTLAAPASPQAPSSVWLARVARLLGARPAELLEGGHLEQHDLAELADTDAGMVADTIRQSSAWLNRPQRAEPKVEEFAVDEAVEPQHFVLSAATAAPEWIAVRDQYVSHLTACKACYAPRNRYCVTGAELRQRYDQTPMKSAP